MNEDYPDLWTLRRIETNYGDEVALIVAAVTKPKRWRYSSDETYDQAVFRRVRDGGPKAKDVKCVDRLHNMLTLVGSSAKRKRKIVQTIRFVLPLAAERDLLLFELMEATKEQMRRLGMSAKY